MACGGESEVVTGNMRCQRDEGVNYIKHAQLGALRDALKGLQFLKFKQQCNLHPPIFHQQTQKYF